MRTHDQIIKQHTRARTILHNAIKAGLVVKPERCQECDSEAPIEAHHDDYSKPLEVRWLCNACHYGPTSTHGEAWKAREL